MPIRNLSGPVIHTCTCIDKGHCKIYSQINSLYVFAKEVLLFQKWVTAQWDLMIFLINRELCSPWN